MKHLRISVANSPNRIAKTAETIRLANCRPPCFTGFEHNSGVLEVLPAANIESKIPPKAEKMIPSIGYPLIRIKDKNFSIRYARMGTANPIKREAKGSIITDTEELKNIPAYIIDNLP